MPAEPLRAAGEVVRAPAGQRAVVGDAVPDSDSLATTLIWLVDPARSDTGAQNHGPVVEEASTLMASVMRSRCSMRYLTQHRVAAGSAGRRQ
jgi:hypothetical protein